MATKNSNYKKGEYLLKDHEQAYVDSVIERLDQAIKWQKPWAGQMTERPFNPDTGTLYKGVNHLACMLTGHSNPKFRSYLGVQAYAEKHATAENPIYVKKNPTSVGLWYSEFREIKDKSMNSAVSLEGTQIVDGVEKHGYYFMKRVGTVFNEDDIVGMPKYDIPKHIQDKILTTKNIEDLDHYIRAIKEFMKVDIIEGQKACFRSWENVIMMPPKDQFYCDLDYYKTLLHEIGHATGVPLGRPLGNKFGSIDYSKEELNAELSSVFMSSNLNLPQTLSTHDNHIAYLQSWSKLLQDDKKAIFKASAHASRSADYQMDIVQKYKLKYGLVQVLTQNVEMTQGGIIMPNQDVIKIINEKIDPISGDVPSKVENQPVEQTGEYKVKTKSVGMRM